MNIVQKIGMKDRFQGLTGTLSGGQQQWVTIARALAFRPAIILADVNYSNNRGKYTVYSVKNIKEKEQDAHMAVKFVYEV